MKPASPTAPRCKKANSSSIEARPIWRSAEDAEEATASALILRLAVEHLARLAAEEEATTNKQGNAVPVAIAYFTRKDREAKKARRSVPASEPSVATKHFAALQRKKAADIEAARARVRARKPLAPLPVDYFVRQRQAERAARANASKERAEAQMPEAVRHFTKTAEVERELRKRAREGATMKNEQTTSTATRHMPAAIQKFTLAAYEERARRRAAAEEARRRMPPVSPGVAHFTRKTKAQRLTSVLTGDNASGASSLC